MLQSAFETQAESVAVPGVACLPHQAPYEILGQCVCPKLLVHHLGAFAPADIHLHATKAQLASFIQGDSANRDICK
jgi:hypothetical protein